MKKINKIAAIMASTVLVASVNAATQGALVHGNNSSISSTGTLDVTLDIDYAIQINELDDLNLGTFRAGSTTDMQGTDNFCVFTNAAAFALTVYSDNQDGFILRSINNSDLIPYDVSIHSVDVNGNENLLESQMVHNSEIRSITEVRRQKDCIEGSGAGSQFKPNMKVTVDVNENNLLSALPDTYKDTIVFVARPE